MKNEHPIKTQANHQSTSVFHFTEERKNAIPKWRGKREMRASQISIREDSTCEWEKWTNAIDDAWTLAHSAGHQSERIFGLIAQINRVNSMKFTTYFGNEPFHANALGNLYFFVQKFEKKPHFYSFALNLKKEAYKQCHFLWSANNETKREREREMKKPVSNKPFVTQKIPKKPKNGCRRKAKIEPVHYRLCKNTRHRRFDRPNSRDMLLLNVIIPFAFCCMFSGFVSCQCILYSASYGCLIKKYTHFRRNVHKVCITVQLTCYYS